MRTTMRLFCVTYIDDGMLCEMCYPAINPEKAKELCKADAYKLSKIISVTNLGIIG